MAAARRLPSDRPRRRFRRMMAAAALAVAATRRPAAARTADLERAAEILAGCRDATGGARWDAIGALVAEGEKTSFGLTGTFRSIEELRTGYFRRDGSYPLFANAEGLDGEGRWRLDDSGKVHPLDSDEARTVAVSEAFLAARGYLFPGRSNAVARAIPPAFEKGARFERVEMAPPGGRTVTLWIDAATHRVDRAVMPLSTIVETIRYRDYREVFGLWLPFEVETDDGDWPDTGTAKLTRYRIAEGGGAEIRRPPGNSTDSAILRGNRAEAPARRDPRSGFLIVEANVDGAGPFPFILDTGGHDIVTPAAASALKLPVSGSGFSNGAGPGSTKTEFTKVRTLSIGGAEVRDQPFLVLHLDLGTAVVSGRRAPVAGILGLEVFERFAVTLDPARERVELSPLDSAGVHAGIAVPLRFTNDTPLVPALLDGHSGSFAVDTGNNGDLIVYGRWAAANGMAGSAGPEAAGESVGGRFAMRDGPARTFEWGGLSLGGVPTMVAGEHSGSLSSRSEAGNVGEWIVSRFRVTFDYRREAMFLEPLEAKAAGAD